MMHSGDGDAHDESKEDFRLHQHLLLYVTRKEADPECGPRSSGRTQDRE